MRFLFVITHYDPVIYGAELFAKKLAESLVELGHEVDLITGKWEESWPDIEVISGVVVYRTSVNKTRYLQTILCLFPLYLKVRLLLTQKKYDVIHTHIFPSLLLHPFLPKNILKVATIQGGDLADYSEIFGPFKQVFKPIISFGLNRADRIHVVSTDLKKRVKQISSRQSVVIPNGVELLPHKRLKSDSGWLKKKYKVSPRSLVFLSSSRLTEKNNLAETIAAVKMCIDKHKDISLLIAGEGHLRAQLSQLIERLGLRTRVVLLGQVDHDRVLRITGCADGFIRVPLNEGFGISILESMSLMTPVISNTVGGLSDFVNQKTAWIASPDAKGIAHTLERFLADPQAVRNQKLTTAYDQVLRKYTWKLVLKEVREKMYGI